MKSGKVVAVSLSKSHTFHKYNRNEITLLKGLGVEGDAHLGKTIKHRSRVAKDPTKPNLRQVHLIHLELFHELKERGFEVTPGLMGENITTQGIDLLNLPEGTILSIGTSAQIKVTGLRNPCAQINSIKEGLMNAVLDKDENGNLIRKAGIMGVVLEGGSISPDDDIHVLLPPPPHVKLERV